MAIRKLLLSFAVLLLAACEDEAERFAAEKDGLLMEFPASDQRLDENSDGTFKFQMSGTIHNTGQRIEALSEVRVVGRDSFDRFVFARDITLSASNLAPGHSLVVEESISVPSNARIFDIGWAQDEEL